MSRRKLSHDIIVDSATQIIETDGVEAMSMRKIAAKVGVEAMSLYNYYPNKNSILDAISERFVQRIPIPEVTGLWKTDIQNCMISFRTAALENPRIMAMLLSRQMFGDNALRLYEHVLSILHSAGFEKYESVVLGRLLMIHLGGTLLREMHLKHSLSPSELEHRIKLLRESGLKHVAESAEQLARPTGEEEFVFGLRVILNSQDYAELSVADSN